MSRPLYKPKAFAAPYGLLEFNRKSAVHTPVQGPVFRLTRQHAQAVQPIDPTDVVVPDDHPEAIPCLRVYNNGDRVQEYRMPEAFATWKGYNADFRPGVALFVRGRCVQKGYLSSARIAAIEGELSHLHTTGPMTDTLDTSRNALVDATRMQVVTAETLFVPGLPLGYRMTLTTDGRHLVLDRHVERGTHLVGRLYTSETYAWRGMDIPRFVID